MPDEPRCSDCIYWADPPIQEPSEYGISPEIPKGPTRAGPCKHCRRYPPHPKWFSSFLGQILPGFPGYWGVFPWTHPNHWCGEFKPKGEAHHA